MFLPGIVSFSVLKLELLDLARFDFIMLMSDEVLDISLNATTAVSPPHASRDWLDAFGHGIPLSQAKVKTSSWKCKPQGRQGQGHASFRISTKTKRRQQASLEKQGALAFSAGEEGFLSRFLPASRVQPVPGSGSMLQLRLVGQAVEVASSALQSGASSDRAAS